MEKKNKQYIYIVQASLEQGKCKIGLTDNLERRLSEYNNMTGRSKDNVYQYLFTCEVKDMQKMENDIKNHFPQLREDSRREIYFYNSALFDGYVDFIKSHQLFIKQVFMKPDTKKRIVKIIKKTTPTLKERDITHKDLMQKARKVKNDEFYTRYEDIEKEIAMYDKEIWINKVVFCNCDDAVGDIPRNGNNTSAFALYFIQNFMQLGLKKLICAHYSGGLDLFNAKGKGYIFTKDGFQEIKTEPDNYTGSFDDKESLRILHDEADIVCTNPPFSRAIDYWKIIIESGKKFLIISNYTNTINTAYIPYFMNGKVWAGHRRVRWYLNPKKELMTAAGHWFTNLPVMNRPKAKCLKIIPMADIPEKNKKYDDTETLLVDNGYIPNDYEKPFAVSANPILDGLLERGYEIVQDKRYEPYTNGKSGFARVLVQKISD
ncbi:MAG: GIY-YIG nuclease family protein [Rickettsiales bacterium]|nr:GIY-YIG nuclease family protein [Rickettsiales bacterium]